MVALLVLVSSGIGVALVGPGSSAAWGASSGSPQVDLEQARRAHEQVRERRGSASARAQRERSRTAFRGLSGERARAAAREMVPSVLTGSAFRSTAGFEVEEFVAPNAAAVRRDGRGSMLLSSLPLRARDRAGVVRAVDLSLEEDGGVVVADNPLVDVAIAPSAHRGVSLGSGVSLRPRDAGDAAGVVSDDKAVVFANTARDQDFVVAPVPQGVETFWQIRSPQAPETMRLAVGVPAGASLRHNERPGGEGVGAGVDSADVVGEDGEVVASILPPVAFDAQGRRLEVDVAVADDVVAYRVAHRSAEVAYPVVLDPAVVEHHNWNDGRGGARFNWYHRTKLFGSGAGDRWSFPWVDHWVHPGKGLHVDTIAGRTLDHHEWGQWMYTSPQDTYIKTARFGNVVYHPYDSMYTGIVGPGGHDPVYGSNWQSLRHEFGHVNWEQRFHCGASDCQGGVDGNSAALGVAIFGTGYRRYSNNAYAGWVTLEMGDRHPPTFTQIQQSATQFPDGPALGTAWTRSSHATTRMVARDRGHGIRTIGLAPRDGDDNPNNDPFSFVFWGDECAGSSDDAPCVKNVDITRQYHNPEGKHEVRVAVEDVVGNRGYASWTSKVDRSAPSSVSLSGALATDGATVSAGSEHRLTVAAEDAHSGVKTMRVTVDGRDIANGSVNRSCTADPGCSATHSEDFSVSTAGLGYGEHELRVVVGDPLGHERAETRTFRVVDRDKPALEVTGGLRRFPVQSGRDLLARATDEGSGMARMVVERRALNEDGTLKAPLETVASKEICAATSGCPQRGELAYRLPEGTPSGLYEFTVRARDAAGNEASDTWRVRVVALRSGSRTDLGLEQWFDLDDTDAGGESTAYVNGETGNLVWHSVPVVNPSRGLSSVVNLTYNAHERGGLLGGELGQLPIVGLNPDDDEILGNDLPGISYRQAGPGFSVSVSGPTRVNEPLGGAPLAGLVELLPDAQLPEGVPDVLRMTMTDADGTAHVFDRDEQSGQWRTPPGLNMRLRFLEPSDATGAQALVDTARKRIVPASVAELEEDRVWELLRPDGVKHFFDRYGFLQESVDRNANVLDYRYRPVSPITGQRCDEGTRVGELIDDATDALGLCVPRLEEVRSPTWGAALAEQDKAKRRMTLEYTEGQTGLPSLLDDPLATAGLSSPSLVGWLSGRGPQIERITDASQRTYEFEYSSEQGREGYLVGFRENAAGAPDDRRSTRFAYEPKPEGPDSVGLGDLDQLTAVIAGDSDQAPRTQIEYEERQQSLTPKPRRVRTLTKRDGSPKHFRYSAAQPEAPAQFRVFERTTGRRHLERRSDLDGEGRPTRVLEQTVELTDRDAAPVAVAGQGQTTTGLVWNQDHKPETVTDALGTPAQRTTQYAYADTGSGAMTRRTVTQGEKSLTWSFDFYGDREGGFIADLRSMIEPGERVWGFEVDASSGNVTSRTTPNGVTMRTEYGPGGVVAREQDEMGRWTTYADFEATGQPQTVTRPGDAGVAPRRWRYRYDERGDVTRVVDPRNGADTIDEGGEFVTTLGYDAFARLTREHLPRDSARAGGDEGPAFVTRNRRFDRDGSVVASTDARGLDTTIDYDAMDKPVAVSQPGSQGREVSRYVYDDAQRLIAETSPRGSGWANPDAMAAGIAMAQVAACEGDGDQGSQVHMTRHCLDHRGRPVASAQYSQRPGDIARRVTAFAYDGRGNQVGVNEPNRNARTVGGAQVAVTIAEAIAAVAEPAQRRTSMTYDLLDRVVGETERPAEAGRPQRERVMVYDDAGDVRQVIEKGPQGGDRVTAMGYDRMGRMLSRTDALGRTTCWARQADGLVSAQTTPRGAATGCPVVSSAPLPHTTRFTYNAAGELMSRSIPYAAQQYAVDRAKSWKVSYERDVVGNPTQITDARGNTITNTFYDSGELRSTTRPSFWELDWGQEEDEQANPQAGERYKGSDAADVEVGTDGPQVVEREGRSTNAEESGQLPDKPDSLGKGDLGEVKPQELPSWLPQAGQTHLRYDPDMRLAGVIDVDDQARRIGYDDAGRVAQKSWPMAANPAPAADERIEHDFTYDLNGNLRRVVEDWRASDRLETTFDYDGYDRQIAEDTEGASADSYGASPVREVTEFAYDANDNLTERTTPRTTAFAYTYDSLDQLTSEANPTDETWRYGYDRHFGERTTEVAPHAASDNAELYTASHVYDRAGQLTRRTQMVDQPGRDPAALVWDFGYDGDGNRSREEAPGAPERQVTEIDHDARGLAWRTTRSGEAIEKPRVSITEYDANGNVRREVNPVGVNQDSALPIAPDDGSETAANLEAASRDATVRTYDADDLQVSERLAWRDSEGRSDERWMREWSRDGQGWVTSIGLPREVGGESVGTQRYDHNAAGWITSSTDDAGIDTTYSYNRQGQQERWRSEHANENDRGRDLTFEYWPNGLLARRSATKRVDTQTSTRTYDYLYNPNRSLQAVIDRDPDRGQAETAQARTTRFIRDDAERETRVDETWRDGNDVQLGYDEGATGWLKERRTDGTFDGAGVYGGQDARVTRFAYDSLGRELSMTVDPAKGENRTTLTRWHPGGQMASRTKPNDTVDEWSWNALGEKTRHVRDPKGPGAGGQARTQDYTYDHNGNRTQDERGTHGFNARDQLVSWERSATRGREDRRGWSTRYELNGSGGMLEKVERDPAGAVKVDSDFVYDGERLDKVTTLDRTQAVAVTTTQTYRYDDAGNTQRIYSRVSAAGDVVIEEPEPDRSALSPDECEAADVTASAKTTRYCYDEFNRQVFASGGNVEPFYVSYDGLDRRDRKVRKDKTTGAQLETRDYTYIGTSELLASESTSKAGADLTRERRSYDYDSQGDRQGQQTDQATGTRYRPYAKDANGSVLGLETGEGEVPETERYDYDPYGELDRKPPVGDAADDPDAGLSQDAKDNPFRFQGFYYDSGVKTYDMHARHYRPDTARFLQSDQYASAAGNQALQADPLTQNRYAFAGANPVTNVEFDGHIFGTRGWRSFTRKLSRYAQRYERSVRSSRRANVQRRAAGYRRTPAPQRRAQPAAKAKPRVQGTGFGAGLGVTFNALRDTVSWTERSANVFSFNDYKKQSQQNWEGVKGLFTTRPDKTASNLLSPLTGAYQTGGADKAAGALPGTLLGIFSTKGIFATARNATKAGPPIKPGTSGGPTAGQRF
ncbi:MAG: hypothetical protein MSC31_18245, partial [Solirubrobacteraceae bacterium MAG38_C4-C5]|nr:hypothetical protein [Candidatus Siliceabacter maunaloa]